MPVFSLYARRALLAGVVSMFAGPALIGCGGGATTPTHANPNPAKVTRGQYRMLEFTLSTMQTYFPITEDVPFVFTIKNTGNAPVTFGDASPQYRAEIRQGNTVIWDRWHGVGFGAGYTEKSLAPGETRRYEFRWNLKNNVIPVSPGQPMVEAMPGAYRVTAYSGMILDGVTNPSTQLAAPPIDIIVR